MSSFSKISQQQLRNRAFEALVKEHQRRSQIEALQRHLNALQHDLAIEAAESQFTLQAFATSECRFLTDRFLFKLPREIRDMVYRHLTSREQCIDSDYFRSTKDPETGIFSPDQARWKTAHFPEHFWNTNHVAAQFVRELSESYYRTSTFVFGDGQSLITRFLDTDQLGLGFAPKELVSNIEVRISAITHDRGSFRAYLFGVPKTPERLQAALEGLTELKAGANVCVQFSTEASSAEERRELFVGALPVLFSKVQVSQLAKYRVRFVLDGKYEFALGSDVLGKFEEQLRSLPDQYRDDGSSFAVSKASPFSPYTD